MFRSGILVLGVDAAQQGLASAVPALSPLTLQSPPDPHTPALRRRGHSSKASILRRSAFFTGQLSHPYMTTGKTIALTRQTLVGKVMSLPLNMLSRLVMASLPRSKHLLISCLQSPSAVILALQYSCLGNPMDRGAWQVMVHGVTKRRKGLSDFHFTLRNF